MLTAALALTALMAVAALGSKTQPEAVASAFVLPQRSDIYDSVTLRGQVVEEGRQPIYPPGPCRVLESFVRVGQCVEAGQALMVLETVGDSRALSAALSHELERAADGLLVGNAQSIEAGRGLLAGALAAGLAPESQELAPGQRFTVISPMAGVIMATAGVGETLSGLLPAIEVSDMSRLAVTVSAPEGSVALLAEGMVCSVRVEAVGSGEVLSGHVATILPYARQTGLLGQSQEVQTGVRIALDGVTEGLRPGYSATAQIITGCIEGGLTIPYEAVRQDDAGTEYLLVFKAGYAIRQDVLTGRELEDCVQVVAGLDEKACVLLGPELEHGQRVALP